MEVPTTPITRQFSAENLAAFAALSGDENPLHLQHDVARRTQFGGCVVHGVAQLLWAIEACLPATGPVRMLRSVRASFHLPLRVGEDVTLHAELAAPNGVRLELRDRYQVITVAQLQLMEPANLSAVEALPRKGAPLACSELRFDEAASCSGTLPLYLDRRRMISLFPRVEAQLSPYQIATLLATTRLVGMVCPGLHSLFSSVDLRFTTPQHGTPDMAYNVRRADATASLVQLDVSAPGVTGTLRAFVRPKPHAQAGVAEIGARVAAREFHGQRALIIGGSRGLGELAAKIVCVGGGSAVVTFHRGESDARRILAELAGYDIQAFRLDVEDPRESLTKILAERGETFTHLYYFATPQIFEKGAGVFSVERYHRFALYYVESFVDIVGMVSRSNADQLIVFSPSSCALEELTPGIGEYIAAKGAFEWTARYLNSRLPGVSIHFPRLPRLNTDQTLTVVPVRAADALDVLLAAMRATASAAV